MIFGKPLSEYVKFVLPFIILIAIVGILRLALSIAGLPNSTTTFLSMTVAVWLGVIVTAVRTHTTGFGSYKQLLPSVVLMNGTSQVISMVAILISILTGQANVFSAPEYSPPEGLLATGVANQWLHLGAHLIVGNLVGSLIGWAIGCVALLITKAVKK